MPFDLNKLEPAILHLTMQDLPNAADAVFNAADEIKALRQALLWYVQNDDTNTGDAPLPEYSRATWNQMNAYWIDGQNRARALLGLELI